MTVSPTASRYAGQPAPVMATNTSSLSLDEMARSLRSPNKLIGVHYMQPAEAWPC